MHQKATNGTREFICQDCLSQYDGRADRDRMVQANRNRKGCDSVRDINLHQFDDLSFGTCPGNFIDRFALYLIRLFDQYQKGVMPFDGPLTSQPAKILEAFEVIGAYNDKVRIEQEKQMKAKNPQGSLIHGRRKIRT